LEGKQAMSSPAATGRGAPSLALILAVLGVVYGDIGTSPLYAMRAAAGHFEEGGVEAWEILGLLSLIIWALILTVTVKYVAFVLRADNRGEGGILALMALAQRSVENARLRWTLALIGIAGACLFFGDGIITPAISVLSAVEGLKVVSPHLEKAVLPISVVILLALFLVQYRGTAKMGAIFGPICAAWFLVLGLLGLWEVLHNPGVLAAISPHWAITFCLHYQLMAFIAFGSVVLAVTGAEALYADMGHFGRRPIRWAWLVIVRPGCAVAARSGRTRKPVLPAGAGMVPPALGVPGNGGHHHREPGNDFRRLYDCAAMRAAWLSAAAGGAPHQQYGRRPDLYAAGEFRPADRCADSGGDIP
jgi:K+ transporter